VNGTQMVSIRPAEARDDSRLAAIDQMTWSPLASPAPRPGPGSPFSKDPKRLDDLLVAEVDRLVVGYVAMHQTISLPSHAHVLEIDGLAVAPAQQGRGIGHRLVEEAKMEAVRRGARKLTLRVLGPNTSARRLYERCGFVIEGVLEGEFVLDGELTDDVLMACRLT
jgi:ribosomal protein S18 acetylase RimI-like enzyme